MLRACVETHNACDRLPTFDQLLTHRHVAVALVGLEPFRYVLD